MTRNLYFELKPVVWGLSISLIATTTRNHINSVLVKQQKFDHLTQGAQLKNRQWMVWSEFV